MVRQESAKLLYIGSIPIMASELKIARVAKWLYARALRARAARHESSSLSPGTIDFYARDDTIQIVLAIERRWSSYLVGSSLFYSSNRKGDFQASSFLREENSRERVRWHWAVEPVLFDT